jgi:hypothetical protein
MSFYSSYFSGDSQMTALNSAISSNATDTALVAHYSTAYAALFTTVASAEATAIATLNQTNLDALATAVGARFTNAVGQSAACSLADQLVNGPTGTIMTRTLSLLEAALQDAITQITAAIPALISSGTVANATLAASLNVQVNLAQSYLNACPNYKKPADMANAIAWLTA